MDIRVGILDIRVGTLDIYVRLGYAKNVPETFRVSLDFESCVKNQLEIKTRSLLLGIGVWILSHEYIISIKKFWSGTSVRPGPERNLELDN